MQNSEYLLLCKQKAEIHLRSAELYDILYKCFNIPVIFMGSLSTIFASTNLMTRQNELSIPLTIVTGISTILHSINSFLEFNVKTNQHKNCSNRFLSLYRNLEFNLVACPENLHKELTDIQENEPIIPWYIQRKYTS